MKIAGEDQREKYILEKGQSLVEVLVGLTTAVMILGAITVATISSLNNAVYGKNQNLATEYAQQAIEIVRNLRDRNYSSFSQLNGNYCLAKTCDKIDPAGGLNDPCGPKSVLCDQNVGGENADIFVRQVMITKNDPTCQANPSPAPNQEIKVIASVAWFDGKCSSAKIFCHTVTLSTCLSTYNVISP